MIATSYVLLYQILLDFIALGFFFRMYPKIAEGLAKFYFSLITVAFLLYSNLLAIYYYPLKDYALSEAISKGIFASSIAYVTFVVHLLFLVIRPSVTKRFHYKLFLVSQTFFFLASFTPYFQEGLRDNGKLFVPVHGPLYKAFIVSYFFWWIYVFGVAFYHYRKLSNQHLRRQASLTLVSVFLMLTLTLLTNGLLPALYGSSQLSLLASLWYLMFLLGIGLIIFQGGERTLKGLQAELELLYNNLSIQNQEAMVKGLGYLIHAFENVGYSFQKKVPIFLETSEKANLYIGHVLEKDEETLDLSKSIPIRWLEGLIDSLGQLERDNFGLALAVQKILHDQPYSLNGDISKYLPASMREDINAYAVEKLLISEAEADSAKTLSPLELAEKKVVEHYLAKNHYNKNRTRKELRITVNTLNAKIQKYGIDLKGRS